ncbi:hypothetical protein AFLA70_343g000941 [Aspergillus flavus AF70]|nr:hypothetical protein AFLA70_343g000941 [Aspergillus flavus AF70]
MCLFTFVGNPTSVILAKETPQIRHFKIGPLTGRFNSELYLHPNAIRIASDIGMFDHGLGNLDLPNVPFQLGETFDLIHIRGLVGIRRAFDNWEFIYEQAFEQLSLRGPFTDTDPEGGTVTYPNSDAYVGIFSSVLHSIAEEAGYLHDLSHLQPGVLRAAGSSSKDVRRNGPDRSLGKAGILYPVELLMIRSL